MGGRGRRKSDLQRAPGIDYGSLREHASHLFDAVGSGISRSDIRLPSEVTGNSKQASYSSKAIDSILKDHGVKVGHGKLPGELGHADLNKKEVTIKEGLSHNQAFLTRVHALDQIRTYGDVKKTSRATRWRREIGSLAVSHLVARELGISNGNSHVDGISHWIRSAKTPEKQAARLKWFESHLGSVQNRAARILSEIHERSQG